MVEALIVSMHFSFNIPLPSNPVYLFTIDYKAFSLGFSYKLKTTFVEFVLSL